MRKITLALFMVVAMSMTASANRPEIKDVPKQVAEHSLDCTKAPEISKFTLMMKPQMTVLEDKEGKKYPALLIVTEPESWGKFMESVVRLNDWAKQCANK